MKKKVAKKATTKKKAADLPAVHTQEMGDLQREAVLFSLKIGQWRIRKNADRSKVETTADKRLVNVRKRILDSAEYRQIVSADTAAREFVLRQSLPSPLGRGVYLLPINLVRSTMKWLREYQAFRGSLIDAFLAVYPARHEEMRAALGDMYNEKDYPGAEEVRARFWVGTMMMELNAPTSLKGISGELYNEEVERIRNVWDEARGAVTQALYEEMAELVGTLSDRLAPRDGKKDQVLRDSVVDKFQEWLDLFQARNLTKDAGLEELVDRAKGIVGGLEAKAIRESPALRKDLAGQFKSLNDQLVSVIGARPSRKIRLDEE